MSEQIFLSPEVQAQIEHDRAIEKLNGSVTPENYTETQAEYFAERYASLKSGEPTWMALPFRSAEDIIEKGMIYGYFVDSWKVADLIISGEEAHISLSFADERIKVEPPISLADAIYKIEALS